ncbi:MAG TPA: imidazole glycerol phosphate synthase subunit HisH [Candidatus Omnitrophica bacterium]|nr:MAG: imidazole glycerol phosphate synthase, glutamine amidotransferase subunit [Omnitrophica WOR_2 bacterium GWA2_45_18]OGX18561.1 MAG: imidazole glycerol phosphate synthase, glutamine amidotransferase subunit [Omnitrophica WOR_2 bacterium GWC2_45_7]HBR15482.1 imidazole glycerol phosphate synthase subunit HisH [Candidatus Omnitrophota bacterium]
MIALIDYGMGNLRSVEKALQKVGADVLVTQDIKDFENAHKIVLPGVGAMQPAMERLAQLGLIPAIQKAISDGKPFLGICLGLQLLFEESGEGGRVRGLGILKGNVERFSTLKVPHMGWNTLKIKNDTCPLFKELEPSSHVYFCHSYFIKPADPKIVATTTDYGIEFASSIHKENIFGVQFHPEKSQTSGLQILKNFHTL